MSNWIKKLFLVVFVLTLTFGLSACQTKPEEGNQVTVTVELYDQTLLVSKEFKFPSTFEDEKRYETPPEKLNHFLKYELAEKA